MPDLVGPIIHAAGQLIDLVVGIPARKAKQRENLATFLDSIADCLIKMEEALAKGVKPTQAGSELKSTLKDYARVVRKAPIDSDDRTALEIKRHQLQRSLTEGQAEDDWIDGKVLFRPKAELKRTLSSLKRTAGQLRAEASKLRAL